MINKPNAIMDDNTVNYDDDSVDDAILAIIAQLSGGAKEQNDSTVTVIKHLQSVLTIDLGDEYVFHPVDICVEPWAIPKWDQIDNIIKILESPKENESKYERYKREFWLRYYSELKVDFASEPIIKFACERNKELSVMDADELIRYTSELSFDVV